MRKKTKALANNLFYIIFWGIYYVAYLDVFLWSEFNDHCGRCSPYADCLEGFCLCKPGYYGNGNDCWPNTDPTL